MLTTLTCLGLVLGAPNLDALLGDVHDTYLKAGDIEGTFTHTFVGGLRSRTKVEEGRLWAKPDGRLRWEYTKPEPKYFVYDGRNAYFYEPEKAQVLVYEDLKQSRYARALRFLIGQGDLRESFAVAACSKHCALGSGDEVVIELTPKEPLANVETLAIVIDPKSKRIKMTVTFDSLGYRGEYRFTQLTFKAKVPDTTFVFKKPSGVQEIRSTQFEPQ